MGMNKIIRKCRTHLVDFRFTANGETSWNFKAEGDSELYDVEGNNIANYTVNGNPITLPYALTAGNSYTVAITKTIVGQVADAKFKMWSSVDKNTVINVPDFGAYNGRYAYLLSRADNVVVKIDISLGIPSNYSGAGAWNNPPNVATIALPELGVDGLWSSISMDNNGDIILVGVVEFNVNGIMCKIKPNDVVYNMDESAQNAYTIIRDGYISFNGYPTGCCFDYVNNYLHVGSSSTGISINLNDYTHSFNSYLKNIRSFPNLFYSAYANRIIMGYTDLDPYTNKTHNYKTVQGWNAIFNRTTGLSHGKSNNSHRNLYAFSVDGVTESFIAASQVTGSSRNRSTNYHSFSNASQIATTVPQGPYTDFALFDLAGHAGWAFALQEPNAGATDWNDIAATDYNTIHLAIAKEGDNGFTRLHFMDSSLLPNAPDFGYLDLGRVFNAVVFNQIL